MLRFLTCVFATVFFIVSMLFLSCNNTDNVQQGQQQIVNKFDSVNQSLHSLEVATDSSDRVTTYSLVMLTVTDSSKRTVIKQMRERTDSFYTYIHDLKKNFYVVCGDPDGTELPKSAEEDTKLTNDFFVKEKKAIWLPAALVLLEISFYTNAVVSEASITDGELLPAGNGAEHFADFYFKDKPPVAAVTILTGFEIKVRTIEKQIVAAYLRNSKK